MSCLNWLLIEGPYYSYELSVCLMGGLGGGSGSRYWGSSICGQGTRGDLGSRYSWSLWSRYQGIQGPGVLKNVVLFRNFQIRILGEKIWVKNCIFKDCIGCWCSKCSSWKMTPFSIRIFQILLFGEEIWGKNYIFEDNIGMWILKMFILIEKMTFYCLGI